MSISIVTLQVTSRCKRACRYPVHLRRPLWVVSAMGCWLFRAYAEGDTLDVSA